LEANISPSSTPSSVTMKPMRGPVRTAGSAAGSNTVVMALAFAGQQNRGHYCAAGPEMECDQIFRLCRSFTPVG
jgi:hypothetical protein